MRRRRRRRRALLTATVGRTDRDEGTRRRADRRDADQRRPATVQPIGGIKVVTENGWFAARPSGTEDVYKIYAESFKGDEHLRAIQEEAQAMIAKAFAAGAT